MSRWSEYYIIRYYTDNSKYFVLAGTLLKILAIVSEQSITYQVELDIRQNIVAPEGLTSTDTIITNDLSEIEVSFDGIKYLPITQISNINNFVSSVSNSKPRDIFIGNGNRLLTEVVEIELTDEEKSVKYICIDNITRSLKELTSTQIMLMEKNKSTPMVKRFELTEYNLCKIPCIGSSGYITMILNSELKLIEGTVTGIKINDEENCIEMYFNSYEIYPIDESMENLVFCRTYCNITSIKRAIGTSSFQQALEEYQSDYITFKERS